jgi:hypothetical protein
MNELVISEIGITGWHYHLREIGPEGVKLGGWPILLCLGSGGLPARVRLPRSHCHSRR